jgi:hypothetical protein
MGHHGLINSNFHFNPPFY